MSLACIRELRAGILFSKNTTAWFKYSLGYTASWLGGAIEERLLEYLREQNPRGRDDFGLRTNSAARAYSGSYSAIPSIIFFNGTFKLLAMATAQAIYDTAVSPVKNVATVVISALMDRVASVPFG